MLEVKTGLTRDRRSILLLIVVMVAVAAGATGVAIYALYEAAIEENRGRLLVTAQSQARLMEAVARFDAVYSTEDVPGGAFAATVGQVRDAHERLGGFGATGDFLVGAQEGDQIIFLLSHQHDDLEDPGPVPFDSPLAEAMRRALLGESGTIIGPDYRGETVLAAYDPVGELNVGVVVKIDLAELQAPFIKTGLLAGAVALVLIFVGIVAFVGVTSPLLQRLEESERKYRTLFDSASEGVLLLSDCVEECNQQACSIWACEREAIVGRSLADFSPPIQPDGADSAEESKKRIDSALAGEPQQFYWQHRRKDGALIDTEMSLKAVEIGGRKLILATVRDITERKRAQQDVVRLATAVEQVAESIVVTDPAGTIQYVNPSFEQTSGYSAEEAIGQNPRILKSGEHDEAFYEELWGTITRGNVWRGHLINKKKDGTLYPEDTTISPIHDPSGEIINYVAVKHDITQEVALQTQLNQAQKMEAIGLLAGGVAHDFNNLLTGITGYAQLVLNELPEDGPLATDLCRVIDVAERAAALTRQLLAFSRTQTLEFKVFDLNDLVENISKLLKRVIGEDTPVEFVPASDLGSVRADPGQIEQVIVNLTVNARDAMQGGGKIIIETSNVILDEDYVRTHAGAKAGPHVMLAVTDTGCGMDADTQQQIFEPFFTTKKVGEGTGLGLATVYGIVKQHEGSIWAYSELGKGTSFKVYLPLVKEEAQALAAGEQRAAAPRGTETILLVEDNEDVRAVSQRSLEKKGYEVLVAAGPDEAEELFSKRGDEIAVLVSDIVMPNMDGASLYSKLQERNESLKVLFMSGYAQNAVLQTNVLEAGMPFMAKPFTAEQLAEKVRQVLDS